MNNLASLFEPSRARQSGIQLAIAVMYYSKVHGWRMKRRLSLDV